ncbi:MAG: hypothetical protein Q9186_001954 [Xanthomendoza sp. 1 TL-2023]
MPRTRSHSSGKTIASVQHRGLLRSAVRFWHRSYAADYIGLVVISTGYLFILTIAEPFHRMFSLDDIAIQFPHAAVERVPIGYNIFYSGITPLLIIVISTLLIHPLQTPNRFHKSHVTVLGLLISVILSALLTDIIKNAVGRPRPDLLARCKPAKGTPNHKLVTIDVCTEKDHHILHDGWRSFPSGHSSFAFSGLGYLSLFLAGQLHIFLPHADLFRVLLALVPLVAAALIAISRCEDYRHDVYDVTVGSILGISVAMFSYGRYYPSLKSRRCDVPYPGRAETAIPYGQLGKLKDEEARVGCGDDEQAGESEESMPLRRGSRERGRRNSTVP